jgi:acetoin utilization deacetylase AcuC-like enzyme
MLQVFDPRQLAHQPALELHNGGWVEHVDRPSRAQAIADRLGASTPATDFGLAPLADVHAADYLEFLSGAHARWLAAGRTGDAIGYAWPVVGRRAVRLDRIDALLGRYSYDAATPISAGTWTAAYWGAQTALTALVPLLDGTQDVAFALCRPPGHHAGRDYLGGYCYLNNAAIAARRAVNSGFPRVAILDVDYHHGNGTQDIFYDDPRVFYLSLHLDGHYPGTGSASETGAGAGAGSTLNIPLAAGLPADEYRRVFDDAVAQAFALCQPELVLVSAGYDCLHGDPLGGLSLEPRDLNQMTKTVLRHAQETAGGRVVAVLEGGYVPPRVGSGVVATLRALAGLDY